MFAKLSRWFVLLAFGLMIFNVVGQIVAQADDSPAAEIELTGVVEAFDNTTVTINGLVIDITGAELGVALQVGAQVRVHGWIDDGRLIAREINGTLDDDDDDNGNDNADDDNGNDNNDDNGNDNDDDNGNDNTDDESRDEAEIIGVLTEITDTTITVGGVVINIEGAEINDDPVVGEIVRVHVSVNDDGTWVAREVDENIDDDDNSAIIVPEGCLVTQPAGWTTYTIRPGDTLSGIAERTDSSTASLALVNCLFDTRLIVAGTTLFVPRAPVAGDDNGNDNRDDDNGNDNDDDNSNDNGDDDDNDNRDSNDNDDDDNGNDNGDDGGNDNDDDDDGGNSGRGGDDDDDNDD